MNKKKRKKLKDYVKKAGFNLPDRYTYIKTQVGHSIHIDDFKLNVSGLTFKQMCEEVERWLLSDKEAYLNCPIEKLSQDAIELREGLQKHMIQPKKNKLCFKTNK